MRKINLINYEKVEEKFSLREHTINKGVDLFLENWKLLSMIANERKIKILFLQPHLTSNNHKSDYLDGVISYEEYYSKMYPLIRKKIIEDPNYSMVKKNFYDLSHILDNNNYYFYDYCHINPKGNNIITQKIINTIFND